MLIAPQIALGDSSSVAPTPIPSPSYYNCDFVDKLPYKGTEILGLAAIFMLLVVNFAVSFLSVTAKQLFPSMLDPVVANRIIAVQKMFPGLGANIETEEGEEENEEESETSSSKIIPKVPIKKHALTNPQTGDVIKYDAVVSAEAYIAGKSVDEDLFIMLVNNQAYDTVSAYCASTVRGYTMLSTMLMCAGMVLSFLSIHNTLVDPTQGGFYGTVSLIGYCLAFLTAMVMCGPPSTAVFRNANIWLTTNIPQTGAPDKMESLHSIGIVGFCLLPMVSHWLYALENKDKMPNYAETIAAVSTELSAAVGFGIASIAHKYCPTSVSKVTGNKLSIAAECVAVLSAFIGFVNYEYYATASCAGHTEKWYAILVASMSAPFLLIARHFCWAPTSFTTPPSLLFMYQGQPVATYGPCPALAFNGSTFNPDGQEGEEHHQSVNQQKELPHIPFNTELLKM